MNKLSKGSNMRWESSRMTLPEYVDKILSWQDEQKYIKKPGLDQQKIEDINEALYIAIEFNRTITFTLWTDGEFNKITGKLHFMDEVNQRVHLVDTGERVNKIDYGSIVEVE